jgi:anaerobic magnesium-protoporphyrin IX monomethyl ester cyclase
MLLNPPGKEVYIRDYFCSKTTKSNYLFHPVDLLGLSGTLAESHELEVIDCMAERMSAGVTLERIRRAKPDVIVSLVGSVSWIEDKQFLAEVALEGIRVFAIGDVLHEAAEERLAEEPWLEAALDDFTNEDVLRLIQRDYDAVTKSTFRLPDGEIVTRDRKDSSKQFRLPRPRHELFPSHGYHFSFARQARFATVLSDYGCPYPCTFCVIGTLGFRTRPVADVLEEIDELRSRGIREIFFVDQTFGIQRERAFELCRAFAEYGDLSWTAFTRPDHADEEMLAAMVSGGCHTVIMGVESADDELLKIYRKGYTASSVAGAFARADAAGLRTVGTFVIGLPEETQESLESTLKLAIRLNLDFMSLNMAVPRFGTDFRSKAVDAGLTQRGDLVMDQGGQEATLQTGTMDRAAMLAMKKKMVRAFYLRPSYLWRRLRSVKSLGELTGQVREGFALLGRNQ